MTTQDDDDSSSSTKPQEEWKSLMGQDLVMKTIHPVPAAAQAKGLELSVQDVVQVQFVGRLAATRHDANDPNAPIFHDTTTTTTTTTDDNDDGGGGWWLQIGQRDVVPALEMAVRFMHVGETALVWSHSKYAYGLAGRTHTCGGDKEKKKMVYELPAESAVAYQITVLRKVERMDEPDTIVQLARARKQQANEMYLHEWAAGAGKARIQQAYQRIAKDMEALLIHIQQQDDNNDTAASFVVSPSVVTEAQTLRINALNNITAVLLRAGDYHAAKAAAVAVLELDPHNFKALVRAAKAALLDPSSEFVEVAKALEAAAAAHADPDSEQDLRKLTEDFARRKQAYEKVSKQMYQKAFDSNNTKSGHGNDRERADDKKTWNKVADAKEKEESSPTNNNNKQQSSSNAAAAVTANSNNHLVKNTKAEPHAWRNWLLRYVLPFIFQLLVSLAVWYFSKLKQSKQEQGGGGGFETESTTSTSTTTTLENPVSKGAGVKDEF